MTLTWATIKPGEGQPVLALGTHSVNHLGAFLEDVLAVVVPNEGWQIETSSDLRPWRWLARLDRLGDRVAKGTSQTQEQAKSDAMLAVRVRRVRVAIEGAVK